MACTATATEEVAARSRGVSGCATRCRSARASIARTSPSTSSPRGQGLEGAQAGAARARPAPTPRTGRRSSTAAPGGTPRRSPSRCATPGSWPPPTTPGMAARRAGLGAAPLHVGRRRGDRRHQRLRHGGRQGRRPLGLALGDPDQRRGLLPGGRAAPGRDGLPARAVLLAGRSDLGRLVRFNQQRTVEPQAVAAYVERLRRAPTRTGRW